MIPEPEIPKIGAFLKVFLDERTLEFSGTVRSMTVQKGRIWITISQGIGKKNTERRTYIGSKNNLDFWPGGESGNSWAEWTLRHAERCGKDA